MKHIFMGQINSIKSYCLCWSWNEDYQRYSKEVIDDFSSYCKYEIHNIDHIIGIEQYIIKTEYTKILETDLIQERCLEYSYIKLDDEKEYMINKVIQCANGDVICYTNKVVKEIQDEKSLEICNKIVKNFEEYQKEKSKLNIKKKKKWYKFWKKEGD